MHGTVGDAGAHDGEEFDGRVVGETEGHRFAGPRAGERAVGQGGLGGAADFIGQFALNVGGREAEALLQLAAAEGGAKTRGGMVDAQHHALPQLEGLPGAADGRRAGVFGVAALFSSALVSSSEVTSRVCLRKSRSFASSPERQLTSGPPARPYGGVDVGQVWADLAAEQGFKARQAFPGKL